ncbi:MAG: alkaline phosphatase family protein [Bythopirellula sp.]|nr:alkaline phosphatase family protein [Bythopirellula sp.]
MVDQLRDETPTESHASSGKRFAKRVLFIGWDGAEPVTLRLLLEAGRLPHLRSLVDSGVALELAVPRPTFTQSAWTSLATGKRPHEHGVLHAFHQVAQGSELRPVTRHNRECNALWNVLNRAGLRTHVVGWPVTHPAESLDGICVSDRFKANLWTPPAGPTVMPAEAAQILIERGMAPHQVEDITLGQLLPAHAIGLREHARLEAMCRDILAQTATLFRAIRWCLDARPWDFAACVFPGIRRCHELANWLRHSSPTAAELCESLVAGCYEHHDLLLGQLLSQIDDSTHVMVVSPTGNACTTMCENSDANTQSLMGSVPRNNGLAVIFDPGVSHRTGMSPRSLLDVAPTILTLLGVPYGKDMGGRPLEALFEGGLVSEAIETWDSHSPHDTFQVKHELTAPTEDTASGLAHNQEIEHLTELGYTDPFDVAASEVAVQCQRTATLNRAISLMDAGLLVQATAVLEQLTQQHPDWFHSRSLLAETYYRGRRRFAAREEIDWLTCHGFENAQLYLLSAAIEFADRQFDRALEELCCARRGKAIPPGASLLAGNIHLRKLNFPAAERAFQQSLEYDGPTASALDGLASVKLHLGEYEEAAVYALDALEKDMRLGKAHYHLSAALYFLNKPQEALQALSSWAAVEPRAAAPYRWMARVYRLLLQNLQQAQACLHQGKAVIRRRKHSLEMARVEDASISTSAPWRHAFFR